MRKLLVDNDKKLCQIFFVLLVVIATFIFFSCSRTACAVDWSGLLQVNVYSTTSKSITLKWSKPSGGDVDKYVVYKAKGNKRSTKVKLLAGTTTKVKIKKLKKNKKYRFVVVAKLKNGKKIQSLVVNAKAQSKRKSQNVKTVIPKFSSIQMKELDRKTLVASVKSFSRKKPFDKKIRFVSSDSKIAKVSSTGLITALSAGTCYIYSIAHNGKVAKTKVVVNQSILVLGYHGVATDREKKNLYPNDRFTIPLSTFEKQMKKLYAKGYRTLSCDEYYQWMKGKISLPKRSVLITFDDARYCAVKNAPAILEKYRMKSTWFIIGERTAKADGSEVHRYTATIDDLSQMTAKYSGVELQGHSYGLHNADAAGKALIYSKTYNDVLNDFSLLNSFTINAGFGKFDYFAYPYGSSPAWYKQGVKDSGLKAAFAFGNDSYAAKTDNFYSISRVGVRTTTTDAMFNKWVR